MDEHLHKKEILHLNQPIKKIPLEIKIQSSITGYNDILLVPEGATNIAVKEIKPSNNYLGKSNKFPFDPLSFSPNYKSQTYLAYQIKHIRLYQLKHCSISFCSGSQHQRSLLSERQLENRFSSQSTIRRHDFPLRTRSPRILRTGLDNRSGPDAWGHLHSGELFCILYWMEVHKREINALSEWSHSKIIYFTRRKRKSITHRLFFCFVFFSFSIKTST